MRTLGLCFTSIPVRRIMPLCILVICQIGWANPYVEEVESKDGPFKFDETLVDPWIENETEIPDLPDFSSLQPLRITGLPPDLELFLDTARVTVDPDDEIVRLWVYLRSKQGTLNGTYEGYRCTTGEYRVYGYATPRRDPPITPAKRTAWRKARGELSTNYRKYLLRNYLCGLRGARPPIEIQNAVRDGKPRDPLLYR